MNKHGLKYFRLYDAEIKLKQRKKTREGHKERERVYACVCTHECVCVRVRVCACVYACEKEREEKAGERARKRIRKDLVEKITILREKDGKEKEVSSFFLVTYRRYFDTSRFAQIKCHMLPLE